VVIENLIRRIAAPVDSTLFSIVLGLLGLGLLTLYSAAYENPSRMTAQLVNISVALSVMWVVAQIPPQTLMRFAPPLYLIGLLLLIAVALFGDIRNGARRWINLGVTSIQPSELMKIAMPLMLAWYFQKRESLLRVSDYAVAVLILALPTLLIARQPDLGTALLVAAAGFFVIFLAGLSWKVIIGLGVTGVAAIPLVLWPLMHDYQRRRILTLLDPTEDPLGAGYHIIQSTIAVGSGGITGKGWLRGTQTHLEFIPERTTDFIFAAFSEEFGLVGTLLLIAGFFFLVFRGLVIAREAPTLFTRVLAGSVSMIFFTYAFVNMGMVSGILPVVGVPLPLISYGGTSMVMLCLGLGILMSIATHKNVVAT
jgi:rod shape determining protein RodA